MFVLDCTINIGEYTFKRVNDIKIVKSVDLLSDTAMIKMPASAVFLSNTNGEERKQLEEELKAGMPVEITLSYKDVFEKKEFTGYVTHIEPRNHMVTIECEDVLYHVRKTRINKNFKETTLKEVLTHIISETNKKLPENATPVKLASNIADINFDNLPLKDKNGAQALKKIVDDYNLRVFINDKDELYGGLRLTTNINESSTYNLQTNVVKHNLKYTKEEDVNLYVKVIGVKKDNTKVEIIVGNKEEGEQRTLHYYNISDEEKLKEIGESELENIKYSGYRGNLTGFLVPHTTRGMKVEIIDEKYPSRNGTYFVPKVTTHFGQSGARRKVELGAII